MSSVDNRIVDMKFNNSTFERGARVTLGTLNRLKSALSFSGSSRGLDNLEARAGRFNMGHMEGAVTRVSSKFIALSTIAITALANITNRAINAGLSIVKSLTIAPVMDGFHEYETNLNSIQTIMSNTGLKGKKGLAQVNSALNELNRYSDKTIYNFSEMARNIGTFTAAGVDLKTATASIKGIANLAAISGSNSQQASTAMYQLSQAISAGRVGLQDWNSVVNAGMGGKVFQTALARTATAMGTLKDQSVKTVGPMKRLTINGNSFRQSITAKPGEQSWLTSDVLTNTLKQFGGNMTRAQLKAEGFKKAQIDAIMEMGRMGTDAATKVKTLSQLMSTLKEAVGSGWAKSFQLIFGNFDEAKSLFTTTSNVLGKMIQNSAKARNKVLGDWKKLGGRDFAIDTIVNSFKALMAVLKPIKDAFHDIFPPMTGKRLFELTSRLRDFTDGLMISDKTSQNLRRTFRGVFAVFDIARQIIGGVIGVIGDLIGSLGDGSGGFLDFTGSIGDLLVSIDNAIKKGHALDGFFKGLGTVLSIPIKVIQALIGYFRDLIFGVNNGTGALKNAENRLSPLAALGHAIGEAFSSLFDLFPKLSRAFAPFGNAIAKALSGVGDALNNAFSTGNFSHVLDTINTGLLAGIVLLLKKFVSNGLNLNFFGGKGGLFDSVTQSFGALTGTLQAMQANVQSKTLLKIAIAVGVLTASVVALSLIDSSKLTSALSAMAVGFGQLLAAMAILTKISGVKGFLKIPMIAASLILLSTAILILTAAVKNLSSLSWTELAKGLLGVSVLLVGISAAVGPLSANASGMIRAGAGILIIAVAMKVLASAVNDFAQMSWAEIGKGLASVGIALVGLGLAMRVMPTGMILQAAALTILGVALKVIASAVTDFANLQWDEILRGMTGIAGALLIIAGAMNLMPPSMVLQAAGLVLVGIALNSIGTALTSMGGMSWEAIAKSLVALAGSLVILAAALALMTGSLAGAAALIVAAGALAILAPVLVTLGGMSWEAIVKGLVTIAGAFLILGAAGLLLGPLSPLILALSVSLLALGAGLALAGAGALAFATAFGIVVAAGAAGVAIMRSMLATIINAIPQALKAFGKGLVAFANAIAKGGPAFVHAFVAILTSMLKAVIRVTPLIARAFLVLLNTALRVILHAVPAIINAGFRLIISFLNAISRHVPKIVNIASDIIVKFLNGISRNIGRIIQAGFNLIIKFIDGLTRAINNNSGRMGTAGGHLATAMINGVISGIRNGAGAVAGAAWDMAKNAFSAAMHAIKANSPSREFMRVGKYSAQGMQIGIDNHAHLVSNSADSMAQGALETVRVTMSKIGDAMADHTEFNPVITPVLDLTKLQNDATKIGTIIDGQPVMATTSLNNASSISADQKAQAEAAVASTPDATTPASVMFQQINNSPKALSTIDIYRNTRNQLSLAKGALAKR